MNTKLSSEPYKECLGCGNVEVKTGAPKTVKAIMVTYSCENLYPSPDYIKALMKIKIRIIQDERLKSSFDHGEPTGSNFCTRPKNGERMTQEQRNHQFHEMRLEMVRDIERHKISHRFNLEFRN